MPMLVAHTLVLAACLRHHADTLFFSAVAVVSIASLNLSLLVNPVGLYQVGASQQHLDLFVACCHCCLEQPSAGGQPSTLSSA
jgi:hypothetical protein